MYDALNALGIPYEVTEHPAAFTVEEIDGLNLPHGELIAKNLFLRDDKGRRHFLLVLRKEKRALPAAFRGEAEKARSPSLFIRHAGAVRHTTTNAFFRDYPANEISA